MGVEWNIMFLGLFSAATLFLIITMRQEEENKSVDKIVC